jgi:hypothetical protein
MTLTHKKIQDLINQSGFEFNAALRVQATNIIWEGVQLFRENEKRSYKSHTGKSIKKPSSSHQTTIGRYNQGPARSILISAICRAWLIGVGHKPTLNHKKQNDTPFTTFAIHIMGEEGIGHIHQHLEEYWSTRKKEWLKNTAEPEKWRLSGGSEPNE